MPRGLLTLGEAVELLRKHYGPPARLPTADPFELILLENVAYLAPPARRREAFEQLKNTVGTSPSAILAAKQPVLEDVTGRGILKSTFAAKLREQKSYSGTYAASRQAATALPAEPRVLQEAHLLLQQHGQTLCKRTAPRCDVCPLARGCAYTA